MNVRDHQAGKVHDGWSSPSRRKPVAAPKAPSRKQLTRPVLVRPDNENAADLAALLRQYQRDPKFRAALASLADGLLREFSEPVDLRRLRREPRYADAVARFAADWKLNRFPAVSDHSDEPAGRQAVDAWLVARFLARHEGHVAPLEDAWLFGGGVMQSGPMPHVIARDAAGNPIVLGYQPNRETGEKEPVYRLRLPSPSVVLSITYDPERESRAEAEESLRAQLSELLDAIEAEYREAGYRSSDMAHSLENHAQWLYRRLVYGCSYPDIVQDWNADKSEKDSVSESGVRMAVHRLAKRLDVSL